MQWKNEEAKRKQKTDRKRDGTKWEALNFNQFKFTLYFA